MIKQKQNLLTLKFLNGYGHTQDSRFVFPC